MTTLLKVAPARDRAISSQAPEYLHWLSSPVIKQAIDKMFDTPHFVPGNHKLRLKTRDRWLEKQPQEESTGHI